jgi:branched-chain amino acid transport system permease protein
VFSTDQLIIVGLNGVSLAMVLFLLATGLELIFGVMNIVNLAHGALFMIGAYVGATIVARTGNFLIAILGSIVVTVFIGLVSERLFFSRIPDHLRQVLFTFGVIYVIEDFCRLIWGGNPIGISTPSFLAGSVKIGELLFPVYRLVLIGIGLLAALGLWLFQEKTRWGAIVRAGVDDKEMVAALGINIKLISTSVFAFGTALAGFSGVIGSLILLVSPGVDWDILVLSLVVIVIGGMGSLWGALVGSLIIGLADNFGKLLIPSVSMALVFLVTAVILAMKPSGILGKKS